MSKKKMINTIINPLNNKKSRCIITRSFFNYRKSNFELHSYNRDLLVSSAAPYFQGFRICLKTK